MSNRFYIDERSGCIAVRDRKIECDSPGLHDDLPGVVWFKMGVKATPKRCPTCGHETDMGMEVPKETIAEAQRICKEMNEKNL